MLETLSSDRRYMNKILKGNGQVLFTYYHSKIEQVHEKLNVTKHKGSHFEIAEGIGISKLIERPIQCSESIQTNTSVSDKLEKFLYTNKIKNNKWTIIKLSHFL